ncbi:MAG: Asp-tRNA(Asn)/Glu-tRNA(Gln) amidotransferase subunit GatB [Chlorobiota bacterium]|nr:Asp-tRNA(Asn)/Glu-tRNA(Gln) amidotransferase subunit GatB [Chlorobiota bacterium]QQS67848.1 MAG: Asp-tRNA(Asn)/Glu-tRNA(Gln) amidotransferase subunit GatB [Chlorobiota bacterium]
MNTNKYEAVIGLEVHAQLLTKTKSFSFAGSEFGATPNTNTDPVVLAHPGVLPLINKSLIEWTVKMGLATNCKIRSKSTFARKNYFYPDLPKGYQISQYEDPICYDGHIEIELISGDVKKIGITRIHIEEDTGKSIHDLDINNSLIDLNRAGNSLIEIVSEPDIRNAQEAYSYLEQIKSIVTYLSICSGNMEDGALRCDANISVRLIGAEKFGTKVEVKNMNSFRNVEKAIEFEISRQITALENNEIIYQETRQWDAGSKSTKIMRTKESANDYRYFPDPDLPPIIVTDELIESMSKELPEFAIQRKFRFINHYNIPYYDATLLTETVTLADYFESTCNKLKVKNAQSFKVTSNVIMTEVLRILTEKQIDVTLFKIDSMRLAELIDMFCLEVISSKNLKDIFNEMLITSKTAGDISKEKGYLQISDFNFIEDAVLQVLSENPKSITDYKNGKTNLFGFLVGQTIKKTSGKANPKLINEILTRLLE